MSGCPGEGFKIMDLGSGYGMKLRSFGSFHLQSKDSNIRVSGAKGHSDFGIRCLRPSYLVHWILPKP